jgi:hypothetical protein
MNFMKDESYVDSDEIEEMPDESGSDLMDLLEHMQRQLTFLEKKVDLLLSRTEGERPFENARPAPRPFRKPYDRPSQRFDRPPRRSRNEGEERERSFRDKESSRDNYSDRRKPGKKPGWKPGGKPRSGFGKKPFHSRFSD